MSPRPAIWRRRVWNSACSPNEGVDMPLAARFAAVCLLGSVMPLVACGNEGGGPSGPTGPSATMSLPFVPRNGSDALLLRGRRHRGGRAAGSLQRLGARAAWRAAAAESRIPEVPVARRHGQVHGQCRHQRLRRAGAVASPYDLAVRQPRGRPRVHGHGRPAVGLLQRRHRGVDADRSRARATSPPASTASTFTRRVAATFARTCSRCR